jgi:hypothetical protein
LKAATENRDYARKSTHGQQTIFSQSSFLPSVSAKRFFLPKEVRKALGLQRMIEIVAGFPPDGPHFARGRGKRAIRDFF